MMTSVSLGNDIEMPSVWTSFGYALGFHVLMFLWNPTILTGGAANHAKNEREGDAESQDREQ